MSNRKKDKRRSQVNYFSLMEVMIAVAIIALLAGLAAPHVINQMKRSKVNAAKSEITTLENVIIEFNVDTNSYPKSLDELVNSNGSKRWRGPYLKRTKVPKDPWGNDYIYTCPGNNGDFDLTSYGADGQPGGTGFNADINNWEIEK